jgi:hypothetical protein
MEAKFHSQTDRGYTKPISPKIGDRYGELTIREFLGLRGNLKTWLLSCDCGEGEAIRTTSSLNNSMRDGRTPCCAKCLGELRRSRGVFRRIGSGDFWIEFFLEHGHVWPRASCERLERKIEEDLEEEGHQAPQLSRHYEFAECSESKEKHVSDFQARIDALYPLQAKENYFWVCIECNELRARGFGCTDCVEFVCIDCVSSENHRHTSDNNVHLRTVARLFGCSRENVRRIESKALGSLRHPKRVRILYPRDPISPIHGAVISAMKDGMSVRRIARTFILNREEVEDIIYRFSWLSLNGVPGERGEVDE